MFIKDFKKNSNFGFRFGNGRWFERERKKLKDVNLKRVKIRMLKQKYGVMNHIAGWTSIVIRYLLRCLIVVRYFLVLVSYYSKEFKVLYWYLASMVIF